MVWKQDLAKLKKELQETGDIKPKGPVPKVAPKPEKFLDIQDEDALFLMAMGKKPAQPKASIVEFKEETLASEKPGTVVDAPSKEQPVKDPSVRDQPAKGHPAEKAAEPVFEDFQTAMQSLKGLKPAKARHIVDKPHAPVSTKKTQQEGATPVVKAETAVAPTASAVLAVEASTAQAEKQADTAPTKTSGEEIAGKTKLEEPAPKPKVEPHSPELIHLAAGMAVDVDGAMDLRGHSTVDAMERLRERVQDGLFLGWRTFHITLGADAELREAFLDYLKSDEAKVLARFAQAPIPMGGAHAWILYYPSH